MNLKGVKTVETAFGKCLPVELKKNSDKTNNFTKGSKLYEHSTFGNASSSKVGEKQMSSVSIKNKSVTMEEKKIGKQKRIDILTKKSTCESDLSKRVAKIRSQREKEEKETLMKKVRKFLFENKKE